MNRKYKAFADFYAQKRFAEMDAALAAREVPEQPWPAGQEQPFPLCLLPMLAALKAGPRQSGFELHKAITRGVTESLLFIEDFEFKRFYEDWLLALRKCVHVHGSKREAEALVSLLIELFAQLKRGEFVAPLAHVALTLFFLNFKIAHFYQSKYTAVMLAGQLPAVLEALPAAHRRALHYYLGRLSLMDNALREAERHFSAALGLRPSHRQRAKLLRLMLPLKAVLGQLPPPALLARPEFAMFAAVVRGMREGRIAEIEAQLARNVAALVAQGTYFLVCECKLIALRNFLFKAHLLLGRPGQLSFALLVALFSFQWERPAELEEVLGALSSLIYKEFVKGAIDLAQQALVLRSRPFPRL